MTEVSGAEIHGLVQEARSLGRDIARFLEVDPPTFLEQDAPEYFSRRSWYLIGLIGGKEVGKSALVNALVGSPITTSSSYGRGTEKAVAYLHREIADEVTAFLDKEIPGRYEIITHSKDDLSRQALLDLPDIDSHYAEHVELTRRILRWMLYPIWIQSVEKYADRKPADLLRQVAEGNHPENFLFCLNKVDQLDQSEGRQALEEIREDFASRIVKNLGLDGNPSPKIWLVSATHPDRFDLPELKEQLSIQRSVGEVDSSRELASRRYCASLLAWADSFHLNRTSKALGRLEERVALELERGPGHSLFGHILPRIESDPRWRQELSERIFSKRVVRWPLVNLIHLFYSPIVNLIRLRLRGAAGLSIESSEEVVEAAFSIQKPALEKTVEAAFARISQTDPSARRIYQDARWWEKREAENTVGKLQRELSQSLSVRQETIADELSPRKGIFLRLIRFLVTYGAVIWFPFGQPILEVYLREGELSEYTLLFVRLFGVSYLLTTALFLFVYFTVLWLFLRRGAQRKVEKKLQKFEEEGGPDAESGLRRVSIDWLDGFLEPIRSARERLAGLRRRIDELRGRVV